jgi:hypothetical protein
LGELKALLSSCLANEDYVLESFTLLEASPKSSCALMVVVLLFSSSWYFCVCATIPLGQGHLLLFFYLPYWWVCHNLALALRLFYGFSPIFS